MWMPGTRPDMTLRNPSACRNRDAIPYNFQKSFR